MPNEQPDGSGVDPNDTGKIDRGIAPGAPAAKRPAQATTNSLCAPQASALKLSRETIAQVDGGSDPVQHDSTKIDRGIEA